MKFLLFGLVVALVASQDAKSYQVPNACAGTNELGGAREPFVPKPGGLFPVDFERHGRQRYEVAARKAVELMNTVSRGQKIELVELLSAQFGVVAGEKFDLELKLHIGKETTVCFVYAYHMYPWNNGGFWVVEPQCPQDPCAPFRASESEPMPEK